MSESQFVEVRPSRAEQDWIRQGRGYLCLSYTCGRCGRQVFYKGLSKGTWRMPRPPAWWMRDETKGFPPDEHGVFADLTKPPFSPKSYVCGECVAKAERGN